MSDETRPPFTGTAPGPLALKPVYEAKCSVSGDQFIVYAPAPGETAGLFTVAHVTGSGGVTPILCRVSGTDLPGYTAGALRMLRKRNTGSEVIVCNTLAWPLGAALPR
ncbi:hypothetical protein [Streptomyces roseolus]|uniref:hypothetical protein n=1 Tax=Streptomyces roseolus TaxID=67358 RepID=UPI003660BE8B